MPHTEQSFRPEELLADVIARLIGDVRHIAVGNASPIPATAAEIKDALSGLKCRCGTHISILKAVKRAAEVMG